jgi:hypothetical protein
MDNERELKEKLLKLFEETDRQEACIQELRQRLYLAEKVCYEANGYLNNTEMPLVPIYLKRMASAVEKWDSYRESNGAQCVVTEGSDGQTKTI